MARPVPVPARAPFRRSHRRRNRCAGGTAARPCSTSHLHHSIYGARHHRVSTHRRHNPRLSAFQGPVVIVKVRDMKDRPEPALPHGVGKIAIIVCYAHEESKKTRWDPGRITVARSVLRRLLVFLSVKAKQVDQAAALAPGERGSSCRFPADISWNRQAPKDSG
jgi:hypothetical protein